MTDLNTFTVIGRLTKTVTDDQYGFGYLQNGTAKANMRIAVNSSKKTQNGYEDEVSYFDVVLFGKMAESLKTYLVKGQQIAVSGRLKQDRWEKDGKKNSKVSLIADTVQLLGGKNENNNSSSPNQNDASKSTFTPIPNTSNDNMYGDGGFPEDIPF